eukprot:scaffold4157_cov136-Cylindrotheca_fusiformis.AAC.27
MPFVSRVIACFLALPTGSKSTAIWDGNHGGFLFSPVVEDLSFDSSRKLQQHFCKDMSTLEEHLTSSFIEAGMWGNSTLNDGYTCACTEADSSLEIECDFTYNFFSDDELSDTLSEVLQFQQTNNTYELVRIDVYDSLKDALTFENRTEPAESYSFEGGQVTGCAGPDGCPCSVCDDQVSFIFDDCGISYSSYCNETYSGAFSIAFDFGSITVPAIPPVSAEDFCNDMTALEVHLSEGYAAFYEYEDIPYNLSANMYNCDCGEAGATLEVECILQYTWGNSSGIAVDKILFTAIDGSYELVSTSWGDSAYGTTDPIETYTFQEGQVAECTVSPGCAGCSLCDDMKSFAIDCIDNETLGYSYNCTDEYYGGLVSTFYFGEISITADKPFVTPEPSVAPEPSAAPAAADDPSGAIQRLSMRFFICVNTPGLALAMIAIGV